MPFDWSTYMGATPSRVVSVMSHANNPSRPEYNQPGGGGYSAPIGGGGAGGAAGGDIGPISQAFQAAQDKANAANESRYKQGMALQNTSMNLASQMGKDADRRIDTQLTQNNANTEQNAVSRGLGNTTIRNSLLNGNKRVANDAKLANNEAVLRNRQSAIQNATNFISAKNEAAPDPSLAAGLMQNATQGAGSAGMNLASIAAALGLGNQLNLKR